MFTKDKKIKSTKELLKSLDNGKCLPSVINEGAIFSGTVSSNDVLEISGSFDGDIEGSIVYIRSTAVAKGRINAKYVRVDGTFEGKIHASSVHIGPTAMLDGEVEYGFIVTEEGGIISGKFSHSKKIIQGSDSKVPSVESKKKIETNN